jgi:hypothetical protein
MKLTKTLWMLIIGIALAASTLGLDRCIAGEPSKDSAEPVPTESKRIVLIAGKPSHPPRMHEFNAGVQLLSECLKNSGLPVAVDISLNGWPKDES